MHFCWREAKNCFFLLTLFLMVFIVTVEEIIIYALGKHDPGSAQNWRTSNDFCSPGNLEHLNIGTLKYWTFEHLKIFRFYHFTIWIFEHSNIWSTEHLNIWIFEHLNIGEMEDGNIWTFEHLNIRTLNIWSLDHLNI